MSRNDEKTSPYWIHGSIAFFLLLTLPPFAFFYLEAVFCFYLMRHIWRVLATGPTHRHYIATRRLAWAVGLTIPCAIYALSLTSPESSRTSPGAERFIVLIVSHLALFALIPVWWVALLLASIPYRLLKCGWQLAAKHKEGKQQEAQRLKWEQNAREAAARAETEARSKAVDQKRRDDARAACELFFRIHAPDIRERFNDAMFQDFVTRYMGNERTPEEVEQRALQLQQMIRQHLQFIKPPPKFSSLDDVAAWYVEQKKRIETLPVGELFKKQHLMQLNMQYAELSEKILEKP